MTDLEQIDEFLENYKKVSPKKYYSEAQINEMFVKDFMDYRRSIMMNEKLSARQKAMILAGMIGAGGLTGGLTSCAQPNTEDNTNIEQEETVTMVNVTFKNISEDNTNDINISLDGNTIGTINSTNTSFSYHIEKGKDYSCYAYTDKVSSKNEPTSINIDSDTSYNVTLSKVVSGKVTKFSIKITKSE